MVAPGWEKVPGTTKSYRRVEQGIHIRTRLDALACKYIWACFLYYEGPPDIDSPWTDEEFDSVQRTLEHYRIETPEWFRKRTKGGQLKVDGHSLRYSDDEKAAALAWAQPKK